MSKTILVVDDEPNVRLNYRTTLETEGWLVVEANSGASALKLLAQRAIDLAILDMRMPEMDGLDLLAEMRKRDCSTPAVIITAYGDIPHAVRAMKLGAIDFLKKPLTPGQLRQITREVLERHEGLPAEETDLTLSVEQLHTLHLKRAKLSLNQRSFEAARAHLGKAMSVDPLSAEAFNLAGVLFEMLADHDNARKHYGQAIKLNSRYEPAQQNMRRILNPGSSRTGHRPSGFGENDSQ